ncbi:ABC transporter permease [Marinobacterium arenosum]|uniref:ABC transporter permease n=1 Tax=Marinobacterium arenosum TaxID=2862496 RepID=UPI001C948852|nr:ABC transporter permease [Marinobacterium arenosum]MBY4679045.1 ABC transporter permease [Marinobacterium arenosum]
MRYQATAPSLLPEASAAPAELPTGTLKQQLRRAERRNRVKAFLLVLPLLLFVGITFVGPLAEMLHRSVYNPLVADSLPHTIEALDDWDRRQLPGEAAYRALAEELASLHQNRQLAKLASRLNAEQSGMRSLMTKSGRRLARLDPPIDAKAALLKIDRRWAELKYWAAINNLGSRYTLSNYLAALDMRYDAQGDIVAQPENRQIYQSLFAKTLGMSLLITLLCLLLGYPLAHLLATLPERRSNLLMILVLLPFWTSLLVRTSAWIVLLQTEGVINDLLVGLGLIDQRVQMVHNMAGTLIAMTHILLPFMVLPLYSVMKSISPSYMRAARSLGARPGYAFVRVYMPQTLPGVGAGALLTFILSIGFYITPALVGGQSGQMISNFIAYHMQTSLNWGLASALGGLLLAAVLLLYYLYNRLVGINNLKVG